MEDERATVTSGQAYALAPMSVMLDRSLANGPKVLYVYLDWRQGCNPDSWASVARMSRDLNVSEDTIVRWRGDLERAGYLTVTHVEGETNRYALHHRIERYLQRDQGDTPRKSTAPTPRKYAAPPPANMRHEHDHVTREVEQEEPVAQAELAPALPESLKEASPQERWDALDATTHPAEALSSSPLTPSLPEELALFDELRLAAKAAGRRPGRARFATVQQRDKLRTALGRLNGQFEPLLQRALSEGICELRRVVDYLDGCGRRIEQEKIAQAQVVQTQPQAPDESRTAWGLVGITRQVFASTYGPEAAAMVNQWEVTHALR